MRNMRGLEGIRKVVCAVALLWLALLVFSVRSVCRSVGVDSIWPRTWAWPCGSTSEFKSAVTQRPRPTFDSSLGYSAAVGLGWGPLRMEGEASWRRTDLGSIKYDKLTVDGH